MLAAWGITTEGRPVLVGLDTGASESTDAWKGLLGRPGRPGAAAPLLVVSDDAVGRIGAVEVVFADSLRQRCAIHRARNAVAKVPVEHQAEVKAAHWAIFDPTREPPGDRSIAVAAKRTADFSATFGRRFPCLGLVWAVLDRASRGWRGVTITPATVRQLQELRRKLLRPPAAGDPGGRLRLRGRSRLRLGFGRRR